MASANFEDFVVEHFVSRAHDIMVACNNAYMENDVDEFDECCAKRIHIKGCLQLLKISLTGHMEALVKEFIRIGAKNCEKFLHEATRRATKRIFPESKKTMPEVFQVVDLALFTEA
ncbi:hypothetical protein MtrunA17_Chr5g0441641 [Medicago truncatula]|uniref:Uncharacterized protein n=1 Tax=Medicago truncatula TaxID=3880 RepID=A0A396HW25_MEDTR|nr:hypothetical protein MtrunA17_Chr5g0441641 [Medicago truncatula]